MDLRCHQWIMYAKRDGICKETGKEIKVGDKILYHFPIPKLHIKGRVFCEESKEYQRWYGDANTGHDF